MGMVRLASNGTLRLNSVTLRMTTDVTVSEDSNAELTNTTTGETCVADGFGMAKISAKCKVPTVSTERRKLIDAYRDKKFVRLAHKSGDTLLTYEGIITSMNLASKVNAGDEFDFEFSGAPEPVQ